MYSPRSSGIAMPMVSTVGNWAAWPQVITTAGASTTWWNGNYAAYYPLLVPTVCVAKRLWWTNGATVSASYNVDVGIYADAGFAPAAKLVSTGSTAQGTASEVQFVDITDTVLAPGRYWLAMTASSTSATFFYTSLGTMYNALFCFQQATALPLPATATAAESAVAGVYIFGFATTASP